MGPHGPMACFQPSGSGQGPSVNQMPEGANPGVLYQSYPVSHGPASAHFAPNFMVMGNSPGVRHPQSHGPQMLPVHPVHLSQNAMQPVTYMQQPNPQQPHHQLSGPNSVGPNGQALLPLPYAFGPTHMVPVGPVTYVPNQMQGNQVRPSLLRHELMNV